ncbi:MAG TPA: UDP-3-O-acyl-N-acetylglucosamine deacetylase [Victivallales bacterium]|nr:UDP-3-O-acyl-N-acetylglucosamine deacetylase [Victivallales bacterium]
MKEKQKTLAGESFFSGIALHTGSRAMLRMKPAPANSGVIFKRVDLAGKPEVKAFAGNVVDVRRGTTIASGEAKVYTVEHVLAALHALGIDNALIEMDGPEPPIADGSSTPYVEMIREAGQKTLDEDVDFFVVKEAVEVEDGATKTRIVPYDGLKISCSVAYGVSPLDAQEFSDIISPDLFSSQIAPARTFCLYKELEQLIRMGLVKGGSLDNAAVIHNGAIICKEELRFENELARHKVLDVIGDLFLLGARVKGHVITTRPGHPTNVMLAKKLLQKA